MKKTTLTLLFVFICRFCFSQSGQQACGDFKSGKFAYRDSSGRIIEITRKGNKQQEFIKETKTITKLKIKWISDCEYELTQVWSNSKALRKKNRHVTRVVITKANGNDSYEYNCACRDREVNGSIGTMVRLE